MKVLILVCLALTLFLLITPKIYAQTASPSPLPSSQTSSTNEFTVQNEPSSIITLLKSFIDGFDSLLGGFIFYTPNPFSADQGWFLTKWINAPELHAPNANQYK